MAAATLAPAPSVTAGTAVGSVARSGSQMIATTAPATAKPIPISEVIDIASTNAPWAVARSPAPASPPMVAATAAAHRASRGPRPRPRRQPGDDRGRVHLEA